MVLVNKPLSQTNLKQDSNLQQLKFLPSMACLRLILNLWSIEMNSFHPLDLDVVMVSLASNFHGYFNLDKTIDKLHLLKHHLLILLGLGIHMALAFSNSLRFSLGYGYGYGNLSFWVFTLTILLLR